MVDLKSRSEIVEDIKKTFEDTFRQANAMPDKAAALSLLEYSFKRNLDRAIANIKEAEEQIPFTKE